MVGYNDMFGIYDGDVHITRSGTPDQPITFEAAFPPGTAYDVFPDDGPATGNTATKPMPVAGRSGNPPMTGSVVAPKNGCVPQAACPAIAV